MEYKVDWLVEGRVIGGYAAGDPDIDFLKVYNSRILDLLEAGQPPTVHIIIDCQDTNPLLGSVFQTRRLLTYFDQSLLGWHLLITQNRIVRNTAQVVTQLTRQKYHSFASTEEAIHFLKQDDRSIDWMNARMDVFQRQVSS